MNLLITIRCGFVALVLAVLAVSPAAHALAIYGGSAGHTTDPGYGLPWDNVGNTGVYLGAFETGYWVITATHVGLAGITLDGISYASVAGSAQQIGSTDLLLYRIDVSSNGVPSLENLTFSSLTPTIGSEVVMIGDAGGVKTWGTNTVESYSNYALVQNGPQTVGLITTYSPITGEAQGQGGDSGGGLFFQYDENKWMLSGILSAVGTLEGTQFTASVAVAFYHDAIVGIVGNAITSVPEPASWAVLCGGAALMAVMVCRRRRRVTA
jgi:hypothetical protein